MDKFVKGTIFSSYEEMKKAIADENAKYGLPLFLLFLRSKRMKDGQRICYFGCDDKNCPARLVVQQKVKIDEEGLTEDFFEITASNLKHQCGRKEPASLDIKPSADAINRLATHLYIL